MYSWYLEINLCLNLYFSWRNSSILNVRRMHWIVVMTWWEEIHCLIVTIIYRLTSSRYISYIWYRWSHQAYRSECFFIALFQLHYFLCSLILLILGVKPRTMRKKPILITVEYKEESFLCFRCGRKPQTSI